MNSLYAKTNKLKEEIPDVLLSHLIKLHEIVKRYELLTQHLLDDVYRLNKEFTIFTEGLAEEPVHIREVMLINNEVGSYKTRIRLIEKDIISEALTRSNGNVSKTARLLRMERATLISKMVTLNLKVNNDKTGTS